MFILLRKYYKINNKIYNGSLQERSFIMKIKKHIKSKAIEKEMDFEFDKLELIGYLEMCFDVLIYKYERNIFLFEIDDNEILSITKVQNDGKHYGWLTVKDKYIPYRYFEKIRIYYDLEFFDDDEEEDQIKLEQKLELDDEELTILKMTGYFMEEDELANLNWRSKTI